MSNGTGIKLKINFNDPDLTLDERDEQAQQLLAELREMDKVEPVNRVPDPNPPPGNKALCGFLAGWLFAEVNVDNVKQFFGFSGQRFSDKSIELEVEANGRKLKLKARSWEELQATIKAAQDFVAV